MTSHEKALNAINARLARLQANLREAGDEAARQFLFQSIIVTIGVSEALNGYIEKVGQHAQRRHGALKQANEALEAEHAELLRSGKDLLEKLKASPADPALRKQIDQVQAKMTAVQKTLRREANALQRELSACLALIDPLATNVRQFGEAAPGGALARVLKSILGQVRDLYAGRPGPHGKVAIDTAEWEASALAEIEAAAGFHDAFARAGYQMTLALELMTLAVSDSFPRTAEDASLRAGEAAAGRLKEITARFSA